MERVERLRNELRENDFHAIAPNEDKSSSSFIEKWTNETIDIEMKKDRGMEDLWFEVGAHGGNAYSLREWQYEFDGTIIAPFEYDPLDAIEFLLANWHRINQLIADDTQLTFQRDMYIKFADRMKATFGIDIKNTDPQLKKKYRL